MSAPLRSRIDAYREDSDEWLIEAARRGGHDVPRRPRPAGTSAWRVLLNAGVPEAEILRFACAASGADPADFSRVAPALSSFLPHAVALRYRVAPLGVRNGVLGVATYNPRSALLERELAFASKHRVSLLGASPSAILRAQGTIYGTVYGTTAQHDSVRGMQPAAPALAGRPPNVARLSLAVPAPSETHAQVPNLADRLLSTAVAEQASEAHLVPAQEGGMLVRFRIDGTLNDRFGVSEPNALKMIHALKLRAGLDMDDTSRSQSGRCTFASPHGTVELRITTEPTMALERIVVRLYSPHTALQVTELGYSTSERLTFEQMLMGTRGLVVVAGPQGAGKTTTLYAALRMLRDRGRTVVTVEEPVERRLDGVQQVDVGVSAYPTVASAARAKLSGDSNVLLVGELADVATAECVVTASAKQRLILTSVEAADMGFAIQRLYELEHDAVALSNAITGVVAQRLLRRLCDACAAPLQVNDLPEQQQRLLSGLPSAKLRQAVGCEQCRGTGYSGRTAIAEVVQVTPELRGAIARRADAPALAQLARECGINNLWDSGMTCVVEGVTSFSELLDHVVPPLEVAEGAVAQQDIDALLAQLLGKPRNEPVAMSAVVAPAGALRVLLVDDDASSRRALARELREAGICVIEAADGASALAYARRLQPDFVVCEIALPRLDAVGLMNALNADVSRPSVIVHTWQQDEQLIAWMREAGAADVLSKSSTAAVLAMRLQQLRQ